MDHSGSMLSRGGIKNVAREQGTAVACMGDAESSH